MGFPQMLAALHQQGHRRGAIERADADARAARRHRRARRARLSSIPGSRLPSCSIPRNLRRSAAPWRRNSSKPISAPCATTTTPLSGRKLAGPNADEIISILTEYTEIKDRETFAAMAPFAVESERWRERGRLKNDLSLLPRTRAGRRRRCRWTRWSTVVLGGGGDAFSGPTSRDRIGARREAGALAAPRKLGEFG